MSDKIDIDTVMTNKVFSGLSKQAVKSMLQNCELFDVATGDYLFRQGSQGDAMFIVVRGSLAVVVDNIYPNDVDGGHKIASISQGSVIGEMCLLGVNKRVADIVAEESSQLIRFPAENFHQGVAKKNVSSLLMAHNIAKILADRLKKANDLLRSPDGNDEPQSDQRVLLFSEILY